MKKILLPGLAALLVLATGGCQKHPGAKPVSAQLTYRNGADCEVQGLSVTSFDETHQTLALKSCITARDGCHQPNLKSYSYDHKSRQLNVEINEVNTAGENQMCTMALTERPYRVEVKLPQAPRQINVVERDVNGKRSLEKKMR